jgi:hypothetical protein
MNKQQKIERLNEALDALEEVKNKLLWSSSAHRSLYLCIEQINRILESIEE